MEVQFTPEQEARISQIANYNGTDPEQLVRQAALRVVEDDAEFHAGVQRGIEQADRGEFIENDEVKTRLRHLFQPK